MKNFAYHLTPNWEFLPPVYWCLFPWVSFKIIVLILIWMRTAPISWCVWTLGPQLVVLFWRLWTFRRYSLTGGRRPLRAFVMFSSPASFPLYSVLPDWHALTSHSFRRAFSAIIKLWAKIGPSSLLPSLSCFIISHSHEKSNKVKVIKYKPHVSLYFSLSLFPSLDVDLARSDCWFDAAVEQIVAVYHSASKQKAWDHFTKAQRKNISVWCKQAEVGNFLLWHLLMGTVFFLNKLLIWDLTRIK